VITLLLDNGQSYADEVEQVEMTQPEVDPILWFFRNFRAKRGSEIQMCYTQGLFLIYREGAHNRLSDSFGTSGFLARLRCRCD
jgi:hypothetical protein